MKIRSHENFMLRGSPFVNGGSSGGSRGGWSPPPLSQGLDPALGSNIYKTVNIVTIYEVVSLPLVP